MTDADPAVPALPTIDPDRETQLTELEGKLDVRLRDRRLLNLAFQHGSFGHGGGGRRESYERLELLGDAVLSLVVCDHLYHRYSDAPEGELAKLRARIVSEPWLARIAQSLDLGRYILLGKGERSEEHTSELQSQSNLVCRLLLEKKKNNKKKEPEKQQNNIERSMY